MRLLLGLFLLTLLIGVVAAQQSGSVPDAQNYLPGRFVDVTAALGVHFNYSSSHTPKHYLPETMGAGVALFDYDNDGRLDIFLVNGAPLKDPTPKGSIPQKTGPNYWNRLITKRLMAPSKTSLTKRASRALAMGWVLPSAIMTTTVSRISTSRLTAATNSTTTRATALSPTLPRKQASAVLDGLPAPLGSI